jgi:hypothetical protein
VFDSGRSYDAWLENAEHPEHVEKMQGAIERQSLDPMTDAALAGIQRPVHVIAFAEDWCGDVVRHVPVLEKMARAASAIEVRYIIRSEHPEVFARFLTNGGEAVPKFVFVSDQFVECGNWGPMPDDGRELIARGKACGDVAAARQKVAALYQADKDRQLVVKELLGRFMTAAAERP